MDQLEFEKLKADALAKLQVGEALAGKDGVLAPLTKAFLEEAG